MDEPEEQQEQIKTQEMQVDDAASSLANALLLHHIRASSLPEILSSFLPLINSQDKNIFFLPFISSFSQHEQTLTTMSWISIYAH